MRKNLFFALIAALVVLSAGVTPAKADTEYQFSFANGSNSISGSGILDVSGGTIVELVDSKLCTGITGCGTMILLPPGAFASNDNAFTDLYPFVTVNGFSFEVTGGVGSSPPAGDFNIYEGTAAANYIDQCTSGVDCVTQDPYGVPSEQIDFRASAIPEPVTFILIGSGLIGLTFLRRLPRRNR